MCYSIFETSSFHKENLVCTRLTRRVYFSKKSFRRLSEAGENPYKGKIEEFTFRRKVFDGNPMQEKTLIKVKFEKSIFDKTIK